MRTILIIATLLLAFSCSNSSSHRRVLKEKLTMKPTLTETVNEEVACYVKYVKQHLKKILDPIAETIKDLKYFDFGKLNMKNIAGSVSYKGLKISGPLAWDVNITHAAKIPSPRGIVIDSEIIISGSIDIDEYQLKYKDCSEHSSKYEKCEAKCPKYISKGCKEDDKSSGEYEEGEKVEEEEEEDGAENVKEGKKGDEAGSDEYESEAKEGESYEGSFEEGQKEQESDLEEVSSRKMGKLNYEMPYSICAEGENVKYVVEKLLIKFQYSKAHDGEIRDMRLIATVDNIELKEIGTVCIDGEDKTEKIKAEVGKMKARIENAHNLKLVCDKLKEFLNSIIAIQIDFKPYFPKFFKNVQECIKSK